MHESHTRVCSCRACTHSPSPSPSPCRGWEQNVLLRPGVTDVPPPPPIPNLCPFGMSLCHRGSALRDWGPCCDPMVPEHPRWWGTGTLVPPHCPRAPQAPPGIWEMLFSVLSSANPDTALGAGRGRCGTGPGGGTPRDQASLPASRQPATAENGGSVLPHAMPRHGPQGDLGHGRVSSCPRGSGWEALGSGDTEFPSLTCSVARGKLGLGPGGWGATGAQAYSRHQRIPTSSPEAAAWQ